MKMELNKTEQQVLIDKKINEEGISEKEAVRKVKSENGYLKKLDKKIAKKEYHRDWRKEHGKSSKI